MERRNQLQQLLLLLLLCSVTSAIRSVRARPLFIIAQILSKRFFASLPHQWQAKAFTYHICVYPLIDGWNASPIKTEDVPPPVSSARILECNQTDPVVTITFDHLEPEDRTKPVEEFWLRYSVDQDVEQGKWHVYPVPVKAFQHEVIGDSLRQVNGRLSIMLKPFGTYAFQLIARNAIGDSAAYNIEGVCQTAQKAPSRNPSGVRVIGTQPDNLIVYWDPMARDEWNGEKFAYKIFYRRKDEDGPWRELVVEDPFADKFAIDLGGNGTRAWDPYEVQVRAMNGKGLSTISPEVVEGRTGFTRYKFSVEGLEWVGGEPSNYDNYTVKGVFAITTPRYPKLHLAVLLSLLFLLFCVPISCCLMCHQHKPKYPVPGTKSLPWPAEPMLPEEGHFEECEKDEETNRSLSGHVCGTGGAGESKSDSLTEFGTDNDRGYNEDGSFVNIYGPGSKNAGLASTNPPQPIAESTPQQQQQQQR